MGTGGAAPGPPGSGGWAMRLLERQAQLRELQVVLERAGRGQGTTVLVSGEAGIGKTWLLQAFAERVADSARVLLGTCEDLLTPRTLGPFRDMAREAGGALGGVPHGSTPLELGEALLISAPGAQIGRHRYPPWRPAEHHAGRAPAWFHDRGRGAG